MFSAKQLIFIKSSPFKLKVSSVYSRKFNPKRKIHQYFIHWRFRLFPLSEFRTSCRRKRGTLQWTCWSWTTAGGRFSVRLELLSCVKTSRCSVRRLRSTWTAWTASSRWRTLHRIRPAPHPREFTCWLSACHFLFPCVAASGAWPAGGGAPVGSGAAYSPAAYGAAVGSAGQTFDVCAAAVGGRPAAPQLQVQLWEVSLRSHSALYTLQCSTQLWQKGS